MMTWSDWHTEPRSNRYHYAKRFSEYLPVIFVQPDQTGQKFYFEKTECENITILHIDQCYGPKQEKLFNQALRQRNIVKLLLWSYNFLFVDIIANIYSPLKVYHATEDYFSDDFSGLGKDINKLKLVLKHSDLLVSVSEGVQEDYHAKGNYTGESIVLTNGCDYNFWAKDTDDLDNPDLVDNKKTLFYEGGINYRLDLKLLKNIALKIPDWDFHLCGKEFFSSKSVLKEWKELCSLPNVKYLGFLNVDQVKKYMQTSTVGIIPFTQSEMIINRSFPLKVFEYLACGLPVVSVPIKSLSPFSYAVRFANSDNEFVDAIRELATARYETDIVNIRKQTAKDQDYDIKFKSLCSEIEHNIQEPVFNSSKIFNILVFYDANSLHVPTLKEHLESITKYSSNNIFYVNATGGATADNLIQCDMEFNIFDAIVIHYSVRVSIERHLSEFYADILRSYGGLKILFLQDEYENTNIAQHWIEDLGIHMVYTCVPDEYLNVVYPQKRFSKVEFIHTLTGFVPIKLKKKTNIKPHSQRKYTIGYRGRALPYWYGLLGQDKLYIGKKMREICDKKGVSTNIEWDDGKRIYGDRWYEFIENCNATLGTESGSNIFDFDGNVSKDIQNALQENSALTFAEAFDRFLKHHEGKVVMNQISPKIFEAISLRTALVLFEGSYSGVVKPDVHFIPLKKDFSNVDEVLVKLRDYTYLEELTERAYKDIIESEKYSYMKFVQDFDELISKKIHRGKEYNIISSVVAVQHVDNEISSYSLNSTIWANPVNNDVQQFFNNMYFDITRLSLKVFVKYLLIRLLGTLKRYIKRIWSYLPVGIRLGIKRLIYPIALKLYCYIKEKINGRLSNYR